MQVTIRQNPLRPPLFQTKDASWLDIRDDSGACVFVMIFPPGGTAFITIDRNDPNFFSTLTDFGIKPVELPAKS